MYCDYEAADRATNTAAHNYRGGGSLRPWNGPTIWGQVLFYVRVSQLWGQACVIAIFIFCINPELIHSPVSQLNINPQFSVVSLHLLDQSLS
jgi:hypothetical protein